MSTSLVVATPPRAPNQATTALTLANSKVFDPALDLDWQRLWLATQRRTWSSLALVPVSDRLPTLVMARALAEVGRRHHGRMVSVIDGIHVDLPDLEQRRAELLASVRRRETVILALPSPLEHPAAMSFADTVDAVLLCVGVGQSAVGRARKIVQTIGADRFIGSALLSERARP